MSSFWLLTLSAAAENPSPQPSVGTSKSVTPPLTLKLLLLSLCGDLRVKVLLGKARVSHEAD